MLANKLSSKCAFSPLAPSSLQLKKSNYKFTFFPNLILINYLSFRSFNPNYHKHYFEINFFEKICFRVYRNNERFTFLNIKTSKETCNTRT